MLVLVLALVLVLVLALVLGSLGDSAVAELEGVCLLELKQE